MDAETRRRAVLEFALEFSNLKQKADDIGVIGFNHYDWIQIDAEYFLQSFRNECVVEKRLSERFPYEAYTVSYNRRIFAVLTEEQYQELGVAADE